ncbi:hypothetical protein ACHAPQ_011351 [Fusarium lateritium]
MSILGFSDDANLLQEVNDNSWIIGQVIVTRHESKPSQPCWPDGKGAFFSVSEVSTPKPPTRPISDACPVIAVIGGGKNWGYWDIGLARLRIGRNMGTPEHATLEALAKRSLDYQVPEAYYHNVFGDAYYIVYSLLPGKSIAEVWPTTKDDAVRTKWAQQIAEAYYELSKWRGDRICGVDGGNWANIWLCNNGNPDESTYDPEVLRQNFEEMGLDCSELVFAHNDMMPLAFMVDEDRGLVGITMWEEAAFVPKDWIRTMTRSNAYTKAVYSIKSTWPWSGPDKLAWQAKIDAALVEKDFKEFWEKNCIWRSKVSQRIDEAAKANPPKAA